jgi:cob(I)alamin adenosyltransferase
LGEYHTLVPNGPIFEQKIEIIESPVDTKGYSYLDISRYKVKQEEATMVMLNKNPLLGKGYVHVYTGNGKGKTTAALGLAFRAMGRGLKTYIGQFMKGQFYGELKAAEMVHPYINIEQYAKDNFIHVKEAQQEDDIRMAREGLNKAIAAMLSGEYDIVVLDEIITSYYFKLITIEEMLGVIRSKPDGVELVFTGRYAPPELVAAADLVTEMKEVKHYYQKKVFARNGIER